MLQAGFMVYAVKPTIRAKDFISLWYYSINLYLLEEGLLEMLNPRNVKLGDPDLVEF
jgi:hypothetical protein